jgi:DMSO/TMAO reductase YedYZ heme-binding membrane subunit
MTNLIKILLPIIYLIAFLIPGYTYFQNNQEITFRLFGLYALTFIWGQLIMGPFMDPLTKLYGPRVFYYHRLEGVFALSFATLHPLLFYFFGGPGGGDLIKGISNYFGDNPVTIYGYLGPIAWSLMVTTVTTALLMNNSFVKRFWHQIHLLNYGVFALAMLHSFNVGSDVQTQPLRSLYLVYLITFLAAFSYRVIYRRFIHKPQ